MTFGLGEPTTAEAEQWNDYYEVSMKIINRHFWEDDQYSLERLERSPQYAHIFSYGNWNETANVKNEETRWAKLPWHLKNDLSLKIKRLICQLRQRAVYLRHYDTIVAILHEMEEVIPKHAILECPITAVTTQTMRDDGWNPCEFMQFWNEPWDDPEKVYKLIIQSIRTRQLITSEAASQVSRDRWIPDRTHNHHNAH